MVVRRHAVSPSFSAADFALPTQAYTLRTYDEDEGQLLGELVAELEHSRRRYGYIPGQNRYDRDETRAQAERLMALMRNHINRTIEEAIR